MDIFFKGLQVYKWVGFKTGLFIYAAQMYFFNPSWLLFK